MKSLSGVNFPLVMQVDVDGGAFWHAARRDKSRGHMCLSACGVYASSPRGLAALRGRRLPDCPTCLASFAPVAR